MEINVLKEFDLNREDGSSKHFYLGVQDATDQDAGHWFTQYHIAQPITFNIVVSDDETFGHLVDLNVYLPDVEPTPDTEI